MKRVLFAPVFLLSILAVLAREDRAGGEEFTAPVVAVFDIETIDLALSVAESAGRLPVRRQPHLGRAHVRGSRHGGRVDRDRDHLLGPFAG